MEVEVFLRCTGVGSMCDRRLLSSLMALEAMSVSAVLRKNEGGQCLQQDFGSTTCSSGTHQRRDTIDASVYQTLYSRLEYKVNRLKTGLTALWG